MISMTCRHKHCISKSTVWLNFLETQKGLETLLSTGHSSFLCSDHQRAVPSRSASPKGHLEIWSNLGRRAFHTGWHGEVVISGEGEEWVIWGTEWKNRIKAQNLSWKQTSLAVVQPLRRQWLPAPCQPPVLTSHLDFQSALKEMLANLRN